MAKLRRRFLTQWFVPMKGEQVGVVNIDLSLFVEIVLSIVKCPYYLSCGHLLLAF